MTEPDTKEVPGNPALPVSGRMKPRTAISASRGTVLDVYDLLRAAKMNVLYYGDRLWWAQTQSVAYTAITTLATSAALGVAWKQAGFTALPKVLGLVAAVLVPLRTVFAFESRIRRLSGLWVGYLSVFHSVDEIARVIRTEQDVAPKQRALLTNAHERFDSLERNDDPSPSGKALDYYREQVIAEIPVDEWWLPPTKPSPSAVETAFAAEAIPSAP